MNKKGFEKCILQLCSIYSLQLHLEIFGSMFPHDIPTLTPALRFVLSQLYPVALVQQFVTSGGAGEGMLRMVNSRGSVGGSVKKAGGEQVSAPAEVVEREKATLDRFELRVFVFF